MTRRVDAVLDGICFLQKLTADSRAAKVDCRQADQKNNAQCRQDKRDTKQDGRQDARDIKKQ